VKPQRPPVTPAEMEEQPGAQPSLFRRALLVAATTRAGIFLVGFAGAALIGIQPGTWARRYPAGAEVFHGVLRYLFNPWAHWDGAWYIKIALNGYSDADGTTAFFPLFPLVLRGCGVLFGGNLVLAGISLSLACYAAAMAVLYRLVAAEFGDRIAYRTVLYLSVFPTTFFFQAVYSESLFLLLAVSCFRWSRAGRWRLAGLAGLLATLTRSTGVLLLVPLGLMYYESLGWTWRRTDSNVASLLLIPEGLMAWMAYLALAFGRPLLFAQSQGQWARSLAAPNDTVWHGIVSAVQGIRQLISHQTAKLYWPVQGHGSPYALAVDNLTALVFTAFAGCMLAYGAKRLPLAYSVYAALAIGFPLLLRGVYQPLLSMPRFELLAFPLFVALAMFTDTRPRAHRAVVAVSLVLLAALTVKFAVFAWVA